MIAVPNEAEMKICLPDGQEIKLAVADVTFDEIIPDYVVEKPFVRPNFKLQDLSLKAKIEVSSGFYKLLLPFLEYDVLIRKGKKLRTAKKRLTRVRKKYKKLLRIEGIRGSDERN